MSNKLICDLETGVCGVGGEGEETMELIDLNKPQEIIDLYYVTDPICSHCWALEPVLLKLTEQYGHYFKLHTVMGGLLKNWDGFADVKNGIGSPSDVAGHWREVGEHSRMPIDGSLWLDNPVKSSYTPSRVFKVIQQRHDEQLARTFLRRAREAVFAFNKNIGEDDVLCDIINQMGLDGESIVKEAGLPTSQALLDQDFALAGKLGVRGFPTIIMINAENKGVKIVGAKSLEEYMSGLQKALSSTEELLKKTQPTLSQLLSEEAVLFSKEIEVMYDLQQDDVAAYIEDELSPEEYVHDTIMNEGYIRLR